MAKQSVSNLHYVAHHCHACVHSIMTYDAAQSIPHMHTFVYVLDLVEQLEVFNAETTHINSPILFPSL